jgi:hypothetical protein
MQSDIGIGSAVDILEELRRTWKDLELLGKLGKLYCVATVISLSPH